MKLIDKDAVVGQANIEITNCRLAAQQGILTEFGKGKLEGLEGIVDFINTLEVIEVGFDLGDPNGDKSSEYIVDTKNLETKEVNLEKENNKELEDEILALNKRYPEVSFAKLSRIAVRVAKWQKEQDKKLLNIKGV